MSEWKDWDGTIPSNSHVWDQETGDFKAEPNEDIQDWAATLMCRFDGYSAKKALFICCTPDICNKVISFYEYQEGKKEW